MEENYVIAEINRVAKEMSSKMPTSLTDKDIHEIEERILDACGALNLFILTYDSTVKDYEGGEIKRPLMAALDSNKAYKVYSFTDSTIFFKSLESKSLTYWVDCINSFKEKRDITLDFTLSIVAKDDNKNSIYDSAGKIK